MHYSIHKLLVNHLHIHLSSQETTKYADCINTMFFLYYFTAFTVTFYHIVHHLNAGNQQKNLHTECKYVWIYILFPKVTTKKNVKWKVSPFFLCVPVYMYFIIALFLYFFPFSLVWRRPKSFVKGM